VDKKTGTLFAGARTKSSGYFVLECYLRVILSLFCVFPTNMRRLQVSTGLLSVFLVLVLLPAVLAQSNPSKPLHELGD